MLYLVLPLFGIKGTSSELLLPGLHNHRPTLVTRQPKSCRHTQNVWITHEVSHQKDQMWWCKTSKYMEHGSVQDANIYSQSCNGLGICWPSHWKTWCAICQTILCWAAQRGSPQAGMAPSSSFSSGPRANRHSLTRPHHKGNRLNFIFCNLDSRLVLFNRLPLVNPGQADWSWRILFTHLFLECRSPGNVWEAGTELGWPGLMFSVHQITWKCMTSCQLEYKQCDWFCCVGHWGQVCVCVSWLMCGKFKARAAGKSNTLIPQA